MREYTRKNADKINAQRRQRRADNADHYRSADRERYQVNIDRKREAKRADYQRHRESRLEWHRKYDKENPVLRKSYYRARYAAKSAEYKSRARAREKSLIGSSYTQEDVDRLYSSQCERCAGCKRSLKTGYEIDHVMPVSRGGSNTADNLQLLCRPCNRAKHAMHPDEWAARLGKLFV